MSVENLAELAGSVDRMRRDYVHAHYGCEWKNPHLYDLMINSGVGDARVVEAIVCAAQPRG
jgi:hypothetical protein